MADVARRSVTGPGATTSSLGVVIVFATATLWFGTSSKENNP